jgi:hypothetical protein
VNRRSLLKLAILAYLGVPHRSISQPRVSLEFVSRERTLNISFSDEELAEFERQPRRLEAVLRDQGARCCRPIDKLSKCVWRCCDGSYYKTCNARLGRILDQILSNSGVQ